MRAAVVAEAGAEERWMVLREAAVGGRAAAVMEEAARGRRGTQGEQRMGVSGSVRPRSSCERGEQGGTAVGGRAAAEATGRAWEEMVAPGGSGADGRGNASGRCRGGAAGPQAEGHQGRRGRRGVRGGTAAAVAAK